MIYIYKLNTQLLKEELIVIVDIISTTTLGYTVVKYITLDTIYANLCAVKALFGLSIMRFMR